MHVLVHAPPTHQLLQNYLVFFRGVDVQFPRHIFVVVDLRFRVDNSIRRVLLEGLSGYEHAPVEAQLAIRIPQRLHVAVPGRETLEALLLPARADPHWVDEAANPQSATIAIRSQAHKPALLAVIGPFGVATSSNV